MAQERRYLYKPILVQHNGVTVEVREAIRAEEANQQRALRLAKKKPDEEKYLRQASRAETALKSLKLQLEQSLKQQQRDEFVKVPQAEEATT